MFKLRRSIAIGILALLAGCGSGGDSSTSSSAASTTLQAPRQAPLRGSSLPGAAYVPAVQELYIAYFGRPADTSGLANFTAALAAAGAPTDIQTLNSSYNSNSTVKSLVDAFGTSAESNALYTGTTTDFVNAIYAHVLNRSSDPSGLQFWVNAIDHGILTKGNAALSIMAGALANTTPQGLIDAQVVTKKVSIGTSFTTTLQSDASGAAAYSGDAAAAAARNMLSTVTSSTDTTAFTSTINSTIASLAGAANLANAPTITSLSPAYGAPGATVTIAGTHFSATPSDNKVWFNGYAATVTAATTTTLTITVPSGASTAGTVSVMTSNGTATSTGTFAVTPTISGFSPTSGLPGAAVTITGTNLSAATAVDFNGSPYATQITARSDTSLTVVVPTGATAGPIILETANGQYPRSTNNFVVLNPNGPTVTHFYPTFGPAGTSVTVYGTNFAPTPANNVVKFSGVTARVTFVSPGGAEPFLFAIVPSGAVGTGPISVTTSQGTSYSTDNFAASDTPPPANTLSVSPNPLSIGSVTTGGYAFKSVTVTNTGTLNVHISGASVSGGSFDYRGTTCYGYDYQQVYHDTLAPGASCTMDVGFGPTASGASAGTLSFTSTATGSPHSVSVSGTGVTPLAPAVSLNPSSLSFAATELGASSAPKTVTLTNTGTATLNISGIGISGEYVQTNVCPAKLAVGANCTITITFKPIRLVGSKTGSVDISSDAPGGPKSVSLSGSGSLAHSGRLAIFTRQPWGVGNVFVDGAWVGRNLKYDSANTCGGVGAITVTLAPGSHVVDGYDAILSIPEASVSIVEGGCTVLELKGTSTCIAPNFVSGGLCYANAPPTCTSPKVFQNGVCVNPGGSASAGTGTGTGTGTGGSTGTNGGMPGTFIGTGTGTNAAACLSFGFLTGEAASYNDTQTMTNTCSFPVYVMHCHSHSPNPGTADSECNAGGGTYFFQQAFWLQPGEVHANFYTMPPNTTIWYGACSGGALPSGKEVSSTGNYVCN